MHRRIIKEIQYILKNPIAEPDMLTVDTDNISEWNIIFKNLKNTPYEKGTFLMKIYIPNEYPFKAPKVKFSTKVYHPNINMSGDVCLEILKSGWNSSITLRMVIQAIFELFYNPNPDDPLVVEIAHQYINNYEQFVLSVREWTKKYAEN